MKIVHKGEGGGKGDSFDRRTLEFRILEDCQESNSQVLCAREMRVYGLIGHFEWRE